ncbi:hypothetical protein NEOLEDRAFT_436115 [Neolentinus lepideus HHB14362 ss-1]|uniref:HMG box domain-containing protein n=1 Tax=Neolentinus lepideus HHB14362 ss-1 TaxID=1314782 RepID=A0A165RW91_9AGAM|nr:hypothetical protein NEOLEDRAFT_436115 [Neolentinus lepideus HHB14362 ss-1]
MHAALTSQSLNADGTPKRPMNAFMIFARKRRPEVSAANQTMRTGDISKILSREWNAMEMSDKQFYLDQAKKLKDNFNAKYPDYVYRRRPNNTRKKRRTDGGVNRLPDSASLDGGDDYMGGTDWEDHSPVEGEDGINYSPELHYPRGHTVGYPNPKDESHDFLPRAGPYSSFDNPGQYGTGHYSGGALSNPHSYSSQVHIAGQSQSPPLYHEHSVGNNWTPSSRVDGRPSGWSGSQPLSLSTQPEQSLSPLSSSSKDLYSPRSWSSSDSSNTSSSAMGVHGQNSAFPTLNSPFYPQTPGALDEGTPHAPNAHYFSSSQDDSFLQRTGGQYDNPTYARSSNISSGSAGFLPCADTLGRSTLSRPLPSIHSMSGYGLQNIHSLTSPASTTVSSSHVGYWDRDRVGGS